MIMYLTNIINIMVGEKSAGHLFFNFTTNTYMYLNFKQRFLI